MAKLFSYDNPIWKRMGRVADFFLLTVLWAVFSLPVLTVGASTAALYDVALRMAENREGYLFSSFVKAFKANLKQALAIEGILLAAGMLIGANLFFLFREKTQMAGMLFWMFLVLAALLLVMAMLIFPLEARLDTGVRNLFLMTFMVGIRHFSWVLLMLVMELCIIAVGVFVFWPLLLFSAGGIAFLHAKVLVWMIFPKYNWNESKEEQLWQC